MSWFSKPTYYIDDVALVLMKRVLDSSQELSNTSSVELNVKNIDESVYFLGFLTYFATLNFRRGDELYRDLAGSFLPRLGIYAKEHHCEPCPIGDWLSPTGTIWIIRGIGHDSGDSFKHLTDRFDLYLEAARRDSLAAASYIYLAICKNENFLDISYRMRWYKLATSYLIDVNNLLRRIKVKRNDVPKESVKKHAENPIAELVAKANSGDADAQFMLSEMCYTGEKVSKNLSLAIELLQKSAEQGHCDAQCMLALMYYQGEEMVKNLVMAAEWYQKAAEQGNRDAQFELANMYYRGEGVGKDLELSIKWLQKSAEQGNSYAQGSLAFMYYRGEGVSKDLVMATKWFQKAAEQGNVRAKEMLNLLKD